MRERSLRGRGIVITRPREQAKGLATRITDHGGHPILFPAIEIRDPADASPLDAAIGRLDQFDLAIFISPVAVERGMAAIAGRRGGLPRGLRLAVVGPGSARALEAHGASDVIVARAPYDSESLLERPELQKVAGKRVLIFRGDGGRELLAQALEARGARVEYAQCYRRCRPGADATPLLDAWSRGELDAFVVTSTEGLRNLCEMLGADGCRRLAATPVFVPHRRIAAAARELHLATVVETASGDDAIVDALMAYFSAHS